MKNSKREKSIKIEYIYIIALIIIIPLVLFVIQVIAPDKTKSAMMSKDLIPNPVSHVNDYGFFNKNLFKDIETYVSDQLTLKDEMIELNSDVEHYLFAMPLVNNFCHTSDGFYFDRSLFLNEDEINDKKEKLVNLHSSLKEENIHLSVAFVPAKSQIIEDSSGKYLKKNGEGFKDTLEDTYKLVSLLREEGVDAYSLSDGLAELYNSGECPYYKTDHHLNADGAFEVYKQLTEHYSELGVIQTQILKKENLKLYTDSHKFYGSHIRRFGGTVIRRNEYDVVTQLLPDGNYSFEAKDSETKQGSSDIFIIENVYDNNAKYNNYYNCILGGHGGFQVLKNNSNPQGPVLMVLGDSFSQAILPMLIYNFSEIHLINVRTFSASLLDYAKSINADEVLFLSTTEADRFECLNP